jgi:protein gp37
MIDQSRLDKGLYWQRVFKVNEGCTKCSLACDNCWSERETVMRASNPNDKIRNRAAAVVTERKKDFTGNILLRHDNLYLPLRVKKPAVFSVWNDLFHEDVPAEFIDEVYHKMALSPQHTFLVLTKRAKHMNHYHKHLLHRLGMVEPPWVREVPVAFAGQPWPLPNIYHGVTVCNQAEADEKIPHLLQVPGKRFLSIEPMLGPIDLDKSVRDSDMVCGWCGGFQGDGHDCYDPNMGIHQVLLGGESGSKAREMNPAWATSVRDQCHAAGVPFFFKQFGEWVGEGHPGWNSKVEQSDIFANVNEAGDDYTGTYMARITKKKAGRTLDGRLHDDLIWK